MRSTAVRLVLALGLAVGVAALPDRAEALITIDFDTEDDGATALINGQIVDPAFDALDLEFGTFFNLTTTQMGSDGHLGATIFDSDPTGPNSGSQDPDLLVDRGNILILQSDNPASAGDTSIDGSVGLIYDNPNDEADFSDRGSFVFSFINPVLLQSIDFVDANGGFHATVILTDGGNLTRTFLVEEKFSQEISNCGICDGYQSLDFTNLGIQVGEGGGTASGSEDLGFDSTDVVKLEIQMDGTPSSGGIDNLTFVPEPNSALLLGGALLALGARRSRRA